MTVTSHKLEGEISVEVHHEKVRSWGDGGGFNVTKKFPSCREKV